MEDLSNSFYNELQNIASQAVPSQQNKQSNVDDMVSKQSITKLTDNTNLAMNMYPEDIQSRFSFWKKENNINFMDDKTKEVYWKTYEKMHPEGIVGAKRDFVDVTKGELSRIDSNVGKEFFLRERLNKTPQWARKELDPLLGEISTNVANSNYSKAQQVYMNDLDSRINSLAATTEFDPDIPLDIHTQDAVKLEQLNLLELGRVEQGRIGVYNEKGKFYPAFGIKDRTEIFPNDVATNPSIQEQDVIRSLSPNIIRKAIEGNLAFNRKNIQIQERIGSSIASDYLKAGTYNIEKWDTAFAMLPNVPIYDKISQGIQGEIESGRVVSTKDLAQTLYKVMTQYGHLFKDKEQK